MARKQTPRTKARDGARRPGRAPKPAIKPAIKPAPKPAGVAAAGLGVRAARAADRRCAILAAALEDFSASCFAVPRLEDVARRAGVAKGTIYLYFRDKESLFQERVRTMLSPVIAGIE